MTDKDQILNEHVAMKLTLQAIRRMYSNRQLRRMIDQSLKGVVSDLAEGVLRGDGESIDRRWDDAK